MLSKISGKQLKESLERKESFKPLYAAAVKGFERLSKPTDGVTQSHPVSNAREVSLNESIGIMLRSYTRAINKQEQRVGGLFREETKAECLTSIDGITPSFYNTSSGTLINISNPEKEYPQICFEYIHFNPVSAGLTPTPEEWEFSSFRDYCGMRDGHLINRERAGEFGIKF